MTKAVLKAIAELRKTGSQMSNVFYNWSQDTKRFTETERAMMSELVRKWDAEERSLPR